MSISACVDLKRPLGLGARAVADPISAVVQDSLAHIAVSSHAHDSLAAYGVASLFTEWGHWRGIQDSADTTSGTADLS